MSTRRRTRTCNEAALDAFLARRLAIQDLLARLQAADEDHWRVGPPEAVDWGTVGTLACVEELLRQAVEAALGA